MGLTPVVQSRPLSIEVQFPVSSRCVTYEILARANGAVDITVTTTSGLTVRRQDLASHAEAQAALQDLRIIVAALNRDLVHSGGLALA